MFLLFSNIILSQEYELLNSISCKTTYLFKDFESLDKKVLSISFFKENWSFVPTDKSPNIDLFLKNFDLSSLSSSQPSAIDFKALNKNYIKVANVDVHFKQHSSYSVFSKPVFNLDKNFTVCTI